MRFKEKLITRTITLTQKDIDTIWDFADEKELGDRGFSAAIRIIIQEWAEILALKRQSKDTPSKNTPDSPA
jgi:hypothetical protein